jgi:hypothetical protein
VKRYRFAAETAVEFEVESAFHWYETEEVGLGFEFLHNFAPAINDYCARPSVTRSFAQAFAVHSPNNFRTQSTFPSRATPL